LEAKARWAGISAAQLAVATLERQYQSDAAQADDAKSARERFEAHFGAVDLGRPTGSDNESIDADLAAEYASNHAVS